MPGSPTTSTTPATARTAASDQSAPPSSITMTNALRAIAKISPAFVASNTRPMTIIGRPKTISYHRSGRSDAFGIGWEPGRRLKADSRSRRRRRRRPRGGRPPRRLVHRRRDRINMPHGRPTWHETADGGGGEREAAARVGADGGAGGGAGPTRAGPARRAL